MHKFYHPERDRTGLTYEGFTLGIDAYGIKPGCRAVFDRLLLSFLS